MAKKQLTPEVKKFFAEIGHRNGTALLEKHGPDYFKRISAMRKVHGPKKGYKKVEPVVEGEQNAEDTSEV